MSFQKTIVSGDAGEVRVEMKDGVVSLTASASVSLGGGEAAGVVKVTSANIIDLGLMQTIDLGLDLAEHAVPAIAPLIEGLKAAIAAGLKLA